MGANLTHVAMAVSPVVNQMKLPFMVMGTGNAVIDPQAFPWSFRTSVSNDIEAAVVTDFVVKRYKAPGMIVDSTAYGQSGETSLRKHLTAHGVTPVAVEKFNLSDLDMTGQVTALQKAGADVMLVWGLGGPLAYLARSADRVGFRVPAFGGLGMHQTAFGKLAGEAGKDWAATTYRAFSRATRADSISPKEKAYRDTMKKRYGSELSPSVEICALWEDTVKVLVDAVRRAGSADPEAIRAALEKTSDIPGFVTTYSYGPGKHDAMRRNKSLTLWLALVDVSTKNLPFISAPNCSASSVVTWRLAPMSSLFPTMTTSTSSPRSMRTSLTHFSNDANDFLDVMS